MNELFQYGSGMLPLDLWGGKQYQTVWKIVRNMTESDDLAWEVFSEVVQHMLLHRGVAGYPLGENHLPDDAPDADENIQWPFSEEDELRHKRMLLEQSARRTQARLASLGRSM